MNVIFSNSENRIAHSRGNLRLCNLFIKLSVVMVGFSLCSCQSSGSHQARIFDKSGFCVGSIDVIMPKADLVQIPVADIDKFKSYSKNGAISDRTARVVIVELIRYKLKKDFENDLVNCQDGERRIRIILKILKASKVANLLSISNEKLDMSFEFIDEQSGTVLANFNGDIRNISKLTSPRQ